jgi:hypothetical protein
LAHAIQDYSNEDQNNAILKAEIGAESYQDGHLMKATNQDGHLMTLTNTNMLLGQVYHQWFTI